MRPRAVFLDWGGTLVSSLQDPFPVYRSVLADHGIEIDRPTFEEAWRKLPPEVASSSHAFLGRTDEFWRTWDRRALDGLGILDREGTIGSALREAFVNPIWHAPFPETNVVLRQLREQGHELHIVSNNTEDLLRTIRNLGWAGTFASVTFSQEVGAEKPDRRIFELALRRADVDASAAVHAGDSWEADVEGARRVGIRPIWVHRRAPQGRDGVATVGDLRGILPLLEPPEVHR